MRCLLLGRSCIVFFSCTVEGSTSDSDCCTLSEVCTAHCSSPSLIKWSEKMIIWWLIISWKREHVTLTRLWCWNSVKKWYSCVLEQSLIHLVASLNLVTSLSHIQFVQLITVDVLRFVCIVSGCTLSSIALTSIRILLNGCLIWVFFLSCRRFEYTLRVKWTIQWH